jgi:PilZ domain
MDGAWQSQGRNSIMKGKVMLNDPNKLPLQLTAKQRSVRRCPLVASAEVTEVRSGARLSARISEVGLGGCYVDALNPFPEETLVRLRILRDQGVFETEAKVVYCDPRFGMGLAFTEVMPDQRSVLETWLTEIVSQLIPNS